MNYICLFLGLCSLFACKITDVRSDGTYYIESYGAYPDDAKDDSKAISRLISTLKDKKGLKKIYFKQGQYIFNSPIRLISDLQLLGNNSEITTSSASNNFVFFLGDYSGVNGTKISGLTIIGNEKKRKNLGIVIKNKNNDSLYNNTILIENCTFQNLGHGIIINNTQRVSIKENVFRNCRNVFNSLNNVDIVISGNALSKINKGLIFVDNHSSSNRNIYILNNRITTITSYPIHFSDVIPDKGHENVLIKGNTIIGDTIPYTKEGEGGSADQISIFGSKDVRIIGNKSMGGGDMGITITRCENVVIRYNDTAYNDRSGITLSATDNVVVKNNSIFNNGQRNDGRGVNCGISIYCTDITYNKDVIISKNLFYDDQDSITQLYSIRAQGKNNQIIEKSNTFEKK